MLNSISSKLQFVGLLAALFLVALTTVWVRTATVKNTYRYVQNERNLKQLERDYQAQRVRWLRLTAPERLEKLAVSLALRPPTNDQLIRYGATNKSAKKSEK